MGSLAGAGLLILARGLQRRLDAAYIFALVLLGIGVVVSLLKGLDYEEAAVLLVPLLALWPCRPFFYRRASLTMEYFTPGWNAAMGTALHAACWVCQIGKAS